MNSLAVCFVRVWTMRIIVFLFFSWAHLYCCVKVDEKDFLIQFLNFLTRSHCIIVDDPQFARSLARSFILTSSVTVEDVPSYIHKQVFFVGERVVIFLRDLSQWRGVFHQIRYPRILSQFTWVILVNQTIDFSVIGSQTIPYDCEFFVVQSFKNQDYLIREIFVLENDGAVYNSVYGTWSRKNGLSLSALKFYSRRLNLLGYPMTVITKTEKCDDNLECSFWEIWSELAKYMNITSKLITVLDLTKVINQTDEGLKWDVLLEPVIVDSYKRSIKAIAPIWKYSVFMHIKNASNKRFSWSAYFSIFQNDVSAVFMGWMILVVFWLKICDYYCTKMAYREKRLGLSDGIFAVFSWICNQDGVRLESNISVLFVICTVRIAVLIMQILGTGVLVSFLTLRSPQFPFLDLRGFLRDKTYKMGAVFESIIHQYFLESLIFDDIDEPLKWFTMDDMPISSREGADKLCEDEKFVFLANNNELMMLERKKCDVLRIPNPVAIIFTGILLNPDSSFEFVFNSAFNRLVESGVTEKMKNKIHGEVKGNSDIHLHPIMLRHVLPFLAILGLGLAAALLSIFGEFIHWRYITRLRRMKAVLKT